MDREIVQTALEKGIRADALYEMENGYALDIEMQNRPDNKYQIRFDLYSNAAFLSTAKSGDTDYKRVLPVKTVSLCNFTASDLTLSYAALDTLIRDGIDPRTDHGYLTKLPEGLPSVTIEGGCYIPEGDNIRRKDIMYDTYMGSKTFIFLPAYRPTNGKDFDIISDIYEISQRICKFEAIPEELVERNSELALYLYVKGNLLGLTAEEIGMYKKQLNDMYLTEKKLKEAQELIEQQAEQLEQKDQQLKQKDQQLEQIKVERDEANALLRNSVRALKDSGRKDEEIASALMIPLDRVKAILS